VFGAPSGQIEMQQYPPVVFLPQQAGLGLEVYCVATRQGSLDTLRLTRIDRASIFSLPIRQVYYPGYIALVGVYGVKGNKLAMDFLYFFWHPHTPIPHGIIVLYALQNKTMTD